MRCHWLTPCAQFGAADRTIPVGIGFAQAIGGTFGQPGGAGRGRMGEGGDHGQRGQRDRKGSHTLFLLATGKAREAGSSRAGGIRKRRDQRQGIVAPEASVQVPEWTGLPVVGSIVVEPE
jgi:hypothetical protein